MNPMPPKPLVHLLLVEDDPVDRLTCQRALAQYSECEFVISEAETGAQGLELARTKPFDCILLDHYLPDFNGIEFLTELFGVSGKHAIPVVMLTGADNAMLAVEALKLGAYDFVVKGSGPGSLQWLPPVILRTLREHQSMQEKAAAAQELSYYHRRLEDLVAQRSQQLEKQNAILNAANTNLADTLSVLKQAEGELRVAAVAFEMQSGIIVTDANKVILRVNRAFARITGYAREKAIGKTPFFLRSGLHGPVFYEILWASLERNGYWEGELWNKRENGELFPVWQTITQVTDPEGHITHYVASFTDITAQKQAEKVLCDARTRLKKQVASSQEELQHIKAEAAEVNTALDVLLKHRQQDLSDAQVCLAHQVEETLLPLLKKLKGQSGGRVQTTRIISILEANLQQLIGSYGHAAHLDAAYRRLTPQEIQVAAMVRQGLATKVIAATLNIALGTVEIHRKHIRKKLGVDAKTNLHSYLLSLAG